MKLLFPLAVLMMLGSPVYAADSISFVVGGHHIHIEAPRHCNSASCVSVSIPGIYQKHGRDRTDDDDRDVAAPTATSASALVQASVVPPAGKATQPAVCAPPSAPVRPIASAAPEVAPPPQPRIQPPPVPQQAAVTPPPSPPPPVIARPAEVLRPTPDIAPRISRTHDVEEEPADSPLGDWQTEGRKGMVRIEPCGQALCGYVLDPSSNAKGETVLIDMKSKAASEWSGSIYSRDSGNIYYGTIAMKGPNSLRVEACALGRFFCSANVWSRADIKPERLISDRGISLAPRS
jgi:hypothetical protein